MDFPGDPNRASHPAAKPALMTRWTVRSLRLQSIASLATDGNALVPSAAMWSAMAMATRVESPSSPECRSMWVRSCGLRKPVDGDGVLG